MEGTQLFCVCAEARRRLKALSLIPPASDLENFTRGKKKKKKKSVWDENSVRATASDGDLLYTRVEGRVYVSR